MTSVNAEEINHFESMADEWWDADGPLKPLHKLNPTRISHIKQQVAAHFQKKKLNDLTILDVGCGGGLVCESLAHEGARVTGLDAGARAIAVAKDHAAGQGLNITYACEKVENHKGQYDIVLVLEVVEHVDNLPDFIEAVLKHVKKGGMVIFSTLNRTAKSYALGIIAAEYILRWLPRGTHHWRKFMKPSELAGYLAPHGFDPCDITGLVYNPFLDHFSLSKTDIAVNYFMSAVRK